VSTDEQTTANQRPEVEQLARARGLDLVATFEEAASASKRRPQYEAMMGAARRGDFDVLVIWALDRFGRSRVSNLADVLELDRVGVQIVSVRESWLDTGGPTRNLLVAIFSWCAEQERLRLVERTRAGLSRARREGKRIGRPRRMDRTAVSRALTMRKEGRSQRASAVALKIPRTTLARALTEAAGAAASSRLTRDDSTSSRRPSMIRGS
jgi:DNA invertase Pin-like site-specific DNA recombinase